jgi:hypothetical protein
MNGILFSEEALLYIAMLIVSAGGTALAAEKWLAGTILCLVGGGVIVVRAILKKKGYEVKNEKKK